MTYAEVLGVPAVWIDVVLKACSTRTHLLIPPLTNRFSLTPRPPPPGVPGRGGEYTQGSSFALFVQLARFDVMFPAVFNHFGVSLIGFANHFAWNSHNQGMRRDDFAFRD